MNVQQNGLSWDSLFGGISNVLDLFKSSSYLGGASGTRQGVKLPPKEIIHLYMPDTLQTSYDSDYSTISLTSAFGLAGYLMNAISDSKMPKSFSEMKSKDIDISQMLNSDFGKFVEANIAGGVAGRFGGNSQDVTALMLQAMKMTPNPQLQLIYKNVGLREFQFSFIFTPSSQKEAEVVDKIINRFNHYSLPQLNNNTSGFSQYLTPPQIFTIEFVPLLGGESKIFNIGDCVLTNIAVDYAPSGWSIYQDNHPVETRMNLMFREMNMRTKADEPLI
jgi:hypothetical protein